MRETCLYCRGTGEESKFGFRGVFTFYKDDCYYCRGKGYIEINEQKESYADLIKKLEEQ